jgi:hypothetical protein
LGWQVIAAVEAEGSVEPHWKEERSRLTHGRYMLTLDLDGKREYLARKDIKAWQIGPTIHATVDGLSCRTGGGSAIADWVLDEIECNMF